MKINAKRIMVFSVVVGIIFVGAAVYGFDWFGIGKGKEIKPPVPGAQAIINRLSEELRNFLIDAHSRNMALKNIFADSNWQNFPLRDYANPATPTGRLRAIIERNLEGLFTTYKSMLRNHSTELDGMLLHRRDGSPYAPGEFMKMMWTGTSGTCNTDLSMSREDIVAEILARTCGAPQAKWIVYYKDNILAIVAELAEAARSDDTTDNIADVWARVSTPRGEDWTTKQQTISDTFGIYGDIFKSAYERTYGSPIPPKFEARSPVLEPFRPE